MASSYPILRQSLCGILAFSVPNRSETKFLFYFVFCFSRFTFIVCVCVFLLVYICARRVPSALRKSEEGIRLFTIVVMDCCCDHSAGAGNQTLVLCKNVKSSQYLRPSLQPLDRKFNVTYLFDNSIYVYDIFLYSLALKFFSYNIC
jgi:hypothetical protein